MRSLAVKIFLSFWIAQVVILVGLEVMRPRAWANVYPPPPPRPSPVFIPTPVLVAAVVVSAVVCFLLARHLASPLKRVREASGRLAAGDLSARAGDMVRPRRDEIGDVVRDFDAMAERLHLLVSAQKQLLSDISHELRSPLARLHVAVELARRKAGPDAENHLNRIEAEGTRMNEMIGQLLTLARADSDRPAMMEEIDLSEIVRSRGNRHRLRGAPDRPGGARSALRHAIVLGDAALLTQRDRKRRSKCEPLYAARARLLIFRWRPLLPMGASVFEITALAFRRMKPNGYFCRSIASARRAIETPAERDWACRSPPGP